MSLKAAVYRLLTTNAALAADVGNDPEGFPKIYPITAPTEVALPYITFDVISLIRDYHLRGATPLGEASVQVNSWSATAFEAESMRDLVRRAVDGIRQFDANGLVINSIHCRTEFDDYFAPEDDTQVGTHVARIELTIIYAESIPANQYA